MLARLESIALAVSRALAAVGLIILLLFAVATLADGIMRSVASAPIEAVRDLGGLVVAVAVAFCFPLSCLQRSNITIKFAEAFIGPRSSRILDAIAAALVEIAVVLIARQLFIYAWNTARAGDSTVMLDVPAAPFWYAAAAALALAAIVQALVVVLEIGRVFGRDWDAGAGEGADGAITYPPEEI
jgi:TRAP-type C4-dicarboxylate transport system permease small subunit